MKNKIDGFKIVSIASTLLTVGSTLLGSYVSKKAMNKTIEELVEKQISNLNK